MKRAITISAVLVCFWLSVFLLTGSGIVPAIVPALVPAANKTSTTSTVFALASSNALTASSAVCTNANGDMTTTACTTNAVTSTTPTTVNTNTTNEQFLQELSLTAGYLNSAGRPFSIFGAGIYTTQTAQTPTLRFRVHLCTVSGCGSGTVITLIDITSGATTAASSSLNWSVNMVSTVATAGATGNLETHGYAVVDLGALTTVADTIYGDTNSAVSGNIDLTAALFLDFSITFSTNAATANTMTQREGVINPGGSTSGGGAGGASVTQTTFAAQPATCTPNGSNALNLQTTGPYLFNCSSTNTYTAFLGSWGQVTVPPSAAWTSDNMNGTQDSTNGSRYFQGMSGSGIGANALRLQYRTAPATPYAITAGIRFDTSGILGDTSVGNVVTGPGIMFRDGTGKVESLTIDANGGTSTSGNIDLLDFTTSTSFSGSVASVGWGAAFFSGMAYKQPLWVCMTDDGTTNVTYQFSVDRRHWTTFITRSRTAFFGSGPTQIGWGMFLNANVAGELYDEQLLDWTVNTAATCI